MASGEEDIKIVLKSARKGLRVMASLFATVSFQIALTPPGGFWQDSSCDAGSQKCHVAGNSILYDTHQKAYDAFVVFNTQVFLASICLIIALLFPSPEPKKEWKLVRFITYVLFLAIAGLFLVVVGYTGKKKLYVNPYHYASFVVWIIVAVYLIFTTRRWG